MPHQEDQVREKLPEYLWASEVHVELGERLVFYFLRTAYSKLAREELRRIIGEMKLPAFTYLLFGQFDFLARVWGTPDTHAELSEKLMELSRRYLGDCISVEVRNVFYGWSPAKPDPEIVKVFCQRVQKERPQPIR
jgi:hypothetical protein